MTRTLRQVAALINRTSSGRVNARPNKLRPLLLGALALATPMAAGLAGCAAPFDASVSRFHRELPAPAGQTFAVVAENPRDAGGLEFGQYASLVAGQLQRVGYVPGNPDTADLVVEFDYAIDKGRDKVSFFGPDPFWSGWHGGFGGGWGGYGGFRGGYGGGYYGRPWGLGFYDPWFSDVDVTTVYTSAIDVKIKRRGDGQRVFEGKAQAASSSNRLAYVVPNLVDALFTGFPGHNGETVRISIAPEKHK